MRTRLRTVIRGGDDGATLIIAILITTVVALVTGAVLTRGDGSLRAAVALRDAARESYATDAAAQVAVNALRTGYNVGNGGTSAFNNTPGTGCFGFDTSASGGAVYNTLQVNNLIPKVGTDTQSVMSAAVTCAPENATGAQGTAVPINSQNKPGYAIVTLNGNVTSSLDPSFPLRVHGGVYANGNIAGSVEVDAGDVRATGTCTATTIKGTANKQCGNGVQPVGDPNYPHELGSSVPTLRIPPTSCTSGVAVFEPGYYDDAGAMNDASNMSCDTLWFKPGNYYFDFRNSGCATYCPATLFSNQGLSNVWTVPRGKTIVGGTPTNVAGAVISMPSANPTLPGSCLSPITNVNAVGVQFVFGNDSRMFLDGNGSVGARMELCATYHADRPPIELYGLKTGGALSVDSANNRVPAGTVTTTQSSGSWTNADAAALGAVGGNAATWTTTGNGNKSATITVPGYTPSPANSIPAGAVLTGATLNVTHKESTATGPATTVTLKVDGAPAATPAVSLPARGAIGSDTITFNATTNAAAFANLQKQVHDYGFGGATTVYSASVSSNGNNTVVIDASTLDLTYSLPVLRGEAGTCVASGSSCPLLSLDPSGNNKIIMYLQGTTYAPLADLNLTLSNFSAEVAKFGVIARQIEFSVNTGNPSWVGPVFEIPDNSPGFGFSTTFVQLQVYLCPGQASGCTAAIANNKVSLRARVQVGDPTGTPVVNAREMSILSWSHTR